MATACGSDLFILTELKEGMKMAAAKKTTKTEPVEKVAKVEKVEKVEPTLLKEQELLAELTNKKVLGVFPGADLVVVTNKFGGDLYIGAEDVAFTADYLIKQGESKEFENATSLLVGSFSRPVFTVQHFKK